MSTELSADERRRKRRLTVAVRDNMRELGIQLALLNHQVGQRLEMRDVDLDCLDIISRNGPLGASALARSAGLHPATMTGILDRLQRGGWAVRQRDPDAVDRRAVTVYPLRDRNPELYDLYSGMSTSMDGICADFSDGELQTLADFLRRTIDAGQHATEQLAND